MKFRLFCALIFLTTALHGSSARYSEELLVRLSHGGGVSGHFRTSHSGFGIYAFTNIPYAAPPVGELRFSEPVKKAPWTGYLPSNRDDIQCPQKQMFSREKLTSGTEDCLYLNVYTPSNEQKRQDLPVMVFIHGGGFTVGSGGVAIFDPAFLLDSNVILVTLNYRLGPLGFLAWGDDMPGNLGMKDQQMALQWVQENIQAFGGDKEKVTIFGISAGGASVGLHMMAPQSKGLFQRAIMQSGTPYDPWVLQDRGVAKRNAEKLFGLLGCDGDKQLMECLRDVKMEAIMETAYEFFEWDVDPLVPFGPVLESSESARPFIQEQNLKEIHDVPLIIGVTQDEGAFKGGVLAEQKDLIADLEKRFSDIIPSQLCYSHLEDSLKREITEKIEQFYLGKKDGDDGFKWGRDKHTYTKIISDGLFVAGFDRFLQQRLQNTNKDSAKTFVYVFNYRGESSFTDLFMTSEDDTNWGVSHGEDMMYLFPTIKLMAPHRIMSATDLKFGAKFVQIFADFATFGDPVHTNEELLWNPATSKFFDYMRIGNCNRNSCPQDAKTRFELLLNPFPERLPFWRELSQFIQSRQGGGVVEGGGGDSRAPSGEAETVINRDEL